MEGTRLIFNNLDEMKLYFVEERNEFVFLGDVDFKFDLNVESDIFVFGDIDGHDITAKNIEAWDINATNILADSIDAFRNLKAKNIFAERLAVYGFCWVEQDIFCESIAYSKLVKEDIARARLSLDVDGSNELWRND